MHKPAASVAPAGRRGVLQSRVRCVALLATASTFFAATAGFTAPTYDGLWSVSIVTNKGDCIGSYRYPMRISNGVVANGGDLLVSVNGKVSAGGAVTVSVTQGSTSAVGSGRLSGSSGRGSRRAASCSGSWTAERRSL